MSYSLQIANGDLSFTGASMGTVQGAQKLVQDLACAILEPMGNDDMHPGYGSVIDGGIDASGNYQPGIIGNPNDAYAGAFVRSEIQRIANNYQTQQVARHQSDVSVYGRSTLTPDEVLLDVSGITTQAAQNQMLVEVTIETGTGSATIAVPVTGA